jgi:hypothetical protein
MKHEEDPFNLSTPARPAGSGTGIELYPVWALLGARMFGSMLDDKLARGIGPETSSMLAARARLLGSKTLRQDLANKWIALTEEQEPIPRRSAKVAIQQDVVLANEDLLHQMVRVLLGPLPAIRGVAKASSLLCDGAGPVYYSKSEYTLHSALTEVIRFLSPA